MMQGNQHNSNAFLDVLLALKQNTMRDLAVADLMIVKEIDASNQTFKCCNLTNTNDFVSCIKLKDLTIQVDDVVLLLFTNSDFRSNFSRLKNGQVLQTTDNKIYHSKNYGVIVGIVYRKEDNNVTE